MNKNKVKIELYKSKVNAKFSHYVAGNIYYTVDLENGTYQFPISTIERLNTNDRLMITLSSDLGTTTFKSEMKGSELNRWIGKAIDKGEFTKVN